MIAEKLVCKITKQGVACPTCATASEAKNLQRAIKRLNGVSNVNVDEVTAKVSIEYDRSEINPLEIMKRLEKLGYQITKSISRGRVS